MVGKKRYAVRGAMKILVLAGALAAVNGVSAQAPSDSTKKEGAADHQHSGSSAGQDGSAKSGMGDMSGMQGMHEMMMKHSKKMESMPMTGDADHDFATMMRMHHQGGIEMANMELQHGKDAKMKAMAKKIVDAQQKEIRVLDDWLASHKR